MVIDDFEEEVTPEKIPLTLKDAVIATWRHGREQEDEELFFVRDPDSDSVSWKSVAKSFFVRTDLPTLSGTITEVREKVAAYEEVSPEYIRHDYNNIHIVFDDDKKFQDVLDYTEKKRCGVQCHKSGHANWTILDLKPFSKKSVRGFPSGRYVIDGKWIVWSYNVEYNPEKANQAVLDDIERIAQLRRKRLEAPEKAKTRKSSMPMNLLKGMFSDARDAAEGFPPIHENIPRKHGFLDKVLLRINIPTTREGYIWSVLKLCGLIEKLGRVSYRTKAFVDNARELYENHVTDPEMTKDFQRFLLRTIRWGPVRQRKKKTSLQKT